MSDQAILPALRHVIMPVNASSWGLGVYHHCYHDYGAPGPLRKSGPGRLKGSKNRRTLEREARIASRVSRGTAARLLAGPAWLYGRTA